MAPLKITRGLIEFSLGLLPSVGADADEPRTSRSTTHTRGSGTFDAEPHPRDAAAAAVEREREPTEELPPIEDDLSGHVETEVEVVAEFADSEAPDPPGPELHVDEPWEGYRRMKVDEIVSRLEGQPAEVLAAVELYESTHRHRGGILNAVRSATRD